MTEAAATTRVPARRPARGLDLAVLATAGVLLVLLAAGAGIVATLA